MLLAIRTPRQAMKVDQVANPSRIQSCAECGDNRPGVLVHVSDIAEGTAIGESGSEGEIADWDADGSAVCLIGQVFDISSRERGRPVGFPLGACMPKAVEMD